MKRFIKIWVRETIQLFLILIGIVSYINWDSFDIKYIFWGYILVR